MDAEQIAALPEARALAEYVQQRHDARERALERAKRAAYQFERLTEHCIALTEYGDCEIDGDGTSWLVRDEAAHHIAKWLELNRDLAKLLTEGLAALDGLNPPPALDQTREVDVSAYLADQAHGIAE